MLQESYASVIAGVPVCVNPPFGVSAVSAGELPWTGVSVCVAQERDLPEMVGDMVQLQHVFTNLFINAADAMEGKGKLGIKARYDFDKNQFNVMVSDTGPGIPEDLHGKIFDIFFTTKPVEKGTGLGLSICKNIIKLHGGNIMVETPPEGGTTFIIELPLGFIEQAFEKPVFVGLNDG